MTGPERRLWNWFHEGVKSISSLFHMQRIESIGSGIPDVEICYCGISWWFELKYADRPARTTTRLQFTSPLTTEQILWQEERISVGGSVFNLIKVGENKPRTTYLINGTEASAIPTMTEQMMQASAINSYPQMKPQELLSSMLYHVPPLLR